MPEPTPVEVIPPSPNGRVVSINPVRLSFGTTLQSPFFWIVVGAAIGIWLVKSKKVL